MARCLSLFLSICFLSVIGIASAANLGMVAKNNIAEIEASQEAFFSLLIWTSDAEQEVLLAPKAVPENWTVVIDKNRVNVSAAGGEEIVLIDGRYVRATRVGVTAVPWGAGPGIYTILISASASKTGGDVSFVQEGVLNLTVRIAGNEVLPARGGGAQENETQKSRTEENRYLYAAVFVLIVFISFLVYKYS